MGNGDMERNTRSRAITSRLYLHCMLLTSLCLPAFPQGPNVGQRLASFRLTDQHGAVQTFETIRGPKGAMIVFYRSADWCTFCKSQLVEMEQSRADLKQR